MHKCKASKGMPCYSVLSALMFSSSLRVRFVLIKLFEKSFLPNYIARVQVNLHHYTLGSVGTLGYGLDLVHSISYQNELYILGINLLCTHIYYS